MTTSDSSSQDSTSTCTNSNSNSNSKPSPAAPHLAQLPSQLPSPLTVTVTITTTTSHSNPIFHGRNPILETLQQNLLPQTSDTSDPKRTRHKQYALCGKAGMGKSAIAREFIRRNSEQFETVLWIPADTVEKMDSAFAQLAYKLGLAQRGDWPARKVCAERLRAWLGDSCSSREKNGDGDGDGDVVMQEGNQEMKASGKGSWLLVFDNANDVSVLSDYWPSGGRGSILITSRNPLAKLVFGSTASLGMDVAALSTVDAAVLLCKLTDDANELMARRIVREVGRSPFAVERVAGFVRREGYNLARFMESVQDRSGMDILQATKLSLGPGAIRPQIASVWAFDSLESEARSLFAVLAFLDHDCIQESILQATRLDFTVPEWIRDFPDTTVSYQRARDVLVEASLVKWDRDLEILSVHQLVQHAFRMRMSPAHHYHVFWATVGLLRSHWPSMTCAPTKAGAPEVDPEEWVKHCWPKCESLYVHVAGLKKIYQRNPHLHVLPNLNFGWLLVDAGWYQFEKGRLHNFDSFFEIAFEMCESNHHSSMRTLLTEIHLALGIIASETNDRYSSRYHRQCVLKHQEKAYRQSQAPDARLCLAYSELAVSYIQDGRYAEAIHELSHSLSIRYKLGSRDLLAETNLGIAYTLAGNLPAAGLILEGGLSMLESKYGTLDLVSSRTGRLLYALGNLRAAEGRLPESLTLHRQALHQFRSTLGEHHHRTADVYHKIGAHLLDNAQYDEALKMTDKALQIWERNSTIYKPEIARTSFLRAKVLSNLGDQKGADEARERAWRCRDFVLETVTDRDRTLVQEDFDALVAFWSL